MKKHRYYFLSVEIVLIFGLVILSFSEQGMTTKELVEKNIQASGGKENITQIKNYSFRSGPFKYHLSSEGQMKITSGREPIITQVILVDRAVARKNCYNRKTEFEGLDKLTYRVLASLRSGFFTLKNFGDQLEFRGIKKFGPQENYFLSTTVGNLTVEFFLDPNEYLLKRMVLKGFSPTAGKYEVSHDFGPLKTIEEVKIPSSWFQSQLGSRGRRYEITDVLLNKSLEKNFFKNYEVNVGKVEVTQGALNGNIVEFRLIRNTLMIGTNWTSDCIQKAGIMEKDKLILHVNDMEIELEFFESRPPRSAFGPGIRLMMPNPRDENYIIYMMSPEYKQLAEELDSLLPIRLIKKIREERND